MPWTALTADDLNPIIDIQLGALLRRLEERKISLTLDDAARDMLMNEGYDPVYGARPLKRVLQRRVLDPLAMGVLQGTFKEHDAVRGEVRDGALVLTAAAASEVAG